MSLSWVAGSVRANSLMRRRIDLATRRDVAGGGSLREGLRRLSDGPYGVALAGAGTPGEAGRAIAETTLRTLRVLAGWLPRGGAMYLRLLAGGFEIANIEDHLRRFTTGEAAVPFRLGALATAWPALSAANSPEELRAALAASPWGDPGGTELARVGLFLRLVWASRVAVAVPEARQWAAGALAILVAQRRFLLAGEVPADLVPRVARLIGSGALGATVYSDYVRRLPDRAAWPLRSARTPGDLWRAEYAWWTRVENDGAALARTTRRFSRAGVIGAAALLVVDGWRARAALECAAGARGGDSGDFSALAG
jgi:hypothetical protein